MGPLPSALSEDFEVIAPVHPGFAGTPRPDWYTGIDDIALTTCNCSSKETSATCSSSAHRSAAGSPPRWRYATTSASPARCSSTRSESTFEGIELADFFSLTPQELIAYSFHNPAAAPDPTQLPQQARDIQAANAATLAVYAREPYMHDPKLRRRLALVPTPVLAIWGESDQIAPEPYGRAYADSFPNGRFEAIPEAGHLPHLEQPEQVLQAIHPLRGPDDPLRHHAARLVQGPAGAAALQELGRGLDDRLTVGLMVGLGQLFPNGGS